MLDRCEELERRAAALYRAYALGTRGDPTLCALWTALAREEEEHARTLAAARRRPDAIEAWRTRIDGWDEALAEVSERLAAAEQLGPGATPDQHLTAALALEGTELEALRHVLLEASRQPSSPEPAAHAARLAEFARGSHDPRVQLQAALLLARARLHQGRPADA